MAQRTHVLLVDDIDGSAADETVTFGLDGTAYEVDLSTANAALLRKSLADYVVHGRRSSLTRGGSPRRTIKPTLAASSVDTATVRAWARDNGYAVNDRGRVAAEIVDAYRAAH
jgi:Lsr2